VSGQAGYHVKIDLRIDWSEQDNFGHVNNVMIMKYMQSARMNYWEKIGIMDLMNTKRTGPMLVSSQCGFRKPLFYPGHITLYSAMEFIRNTSFGLRHIITDAQGDIAAEAHDIMVMYDFPLGRKTPFPADLRKIAEKLEGRVL
jgi:acyl-CoA thioester hydrolase